MTADEFIAWAIRQPRRPRYELVDGEIVTMLPERAGHARTKLADYFRLASVRHYLIVSISRRTVIHHRKLGGGEIRTRILNDGELQLDPPGLTPPVSGSFL